MTIRCPWKNEDRVVYGDGVYGCGSTNVVIYARNTKRHSYDRETCNEILCLNCGQKWHSRGNIYGIPEINPEDKAEYESVPSYINGSSHVKDAVFDALIAVTKARIKFDNDWFILPASDRPPTLPRKYPYPILCQNPFPAPRKPLPGPSDPSQPS